MTLLLPRAARACEEGGAISESQSAANIAVVVTALAALAAAALWTRSRQRPLLAAIPMLLLLAQPRWTVSPYVGDCGRSMNALAWCVAIAALIAAGGYAALSRSPEIGGLRRTLRTAERER